MTPICIILLNQFQIGSIIRRWHRYGRTDTFRFAILVNKTENNNSSKYLWSKRWQILSIKRLVARSLIYKQNKRTSRDLHNWDSLPNRSFSGNFQSDNGHNDSPAICAGHQTSKYLAAIILFTETCINYFFIAMCWCSRRSLVWHSNHLTAVIGFSIL